MLRPASLPPALRAVRVAVAGLLVAGLPTVLAAGPSAALVAGTGNTRPDVTAPSGHTSAHTSAHTSGHTSAPAASRQVAAVEDEEPLEVRLTTLAPAVVPEERAVRVRGTITNRTAEEWTTVNVHAFRSTSPIGDALALAGAAATDPAEPVGSRITAPGTFDTIETLAPGETTRFSLRVPREDLGITGEAGVYWFGVHALGDSPSLPSDGVSDGRARTFWPLVETGRGTGGPVDASVVVPIRASVQHQPDGRVAHPRGWRRLLAPGGRLRDLVDLATATGSDELTWLVDPAVPATVAQLAAGNPERSIDPDPDLAPPEEGEGPGDSGPEDEPAESPGAIPGSQPDEEDELTAAEEQLAGLAKAWLEDFRTRLAGDPVLALPYGDLDLDAAAEHGPEWYDAATTRSADVLAELGIDAGPAVTSRSGVLSPGAVELVDRDATVLLSDTAFVAPPDAPDSLVSVLGREAVLTSSGAAAGGPGPEAPYSSIAVRQRLLSEAALRVVDGSRRPVVAVLPGDWHPQEPDDLFASLDDQRWLRPVPVGQVATGEAAEVPDSELAYTEADARARLDRATFATAEGLRSTARVLDGVLLTPSRLPAQVTGETLSSLSYSDRDHQQEAVSRTRAATGRLNDLLRSVRVEVPPSVTLSSQSGSLGATVVNGLDQPVQVAIRARSDGSLELQDTETLELAPRSRTRVLLNVTAHRLGIHNVRLVVTDGSGRPLGAGVELPIRAAQVSEVIWVIIGVGGALLFGAIVVRLVRRLRGVRFRKRAEAAP